MARFQPGQGGRPKGSRNKLSADFISARAAEFEAHGAEAIRIARIEDPMGFIKVVASILPRELEINTTTQLEQLSDDDLNRFIEYARRQLDGTDARLIECRPIGELERGEKAETDRE